MGIAGMATLVVFVLAASTLVTSNQYPTEQTAKMAFNLPVDFTKVRRILMRTEATKAITNLAGDSKFLDEKWERITPAIDLSSGLVPSLNLELRAKLKVQSLDDYIGRPIVHLNQVVSITGDEIDSNIKLAEPTERLLQYHLVTRYVPGEDPSETRVEMRLTQEILTTAPWFAHRIADNRVYASAEATLEHQAEAIRQLISENQDKSGFWPIP